MMQPNELRIGNWVKWPKEKEPNEVEWEHGHWLGVHHKNYSFPEPIRLTEEWLVKLGFIEDEPHLILTINRKRGDKWHDFYEWQILYDQYSKRFSLFIKGLGSAGNLNIEYVHQLQNLYFALTGEELTISEPTKQSDEKTNTMAG